jgi:hypothetical protein
MCVVTGAPKRTRRTVRMGVPSRMVKVRERREACFDFLAVHLLVIILGFLAFL